MHLDLATIEHIVAIAGGIVVGVVAFYALYKDWRTPGTENQVFKIMLFLLGVGAVVAILAGAGVLGNFPPSKGA
jgi:F0F1-type ATP synthase membrane subunit c/vacuolar-type H+-ATPase subunit K